MTRRLAPTLVPHVLAVALLAGLAWFIRLPIQGDISLYSPDLASILVIGVGLIVAGCLAWWRLGRTGALIVADLLALLPIAFTSLVFFFIPVTAIAAILLLVGLRSARVDDGDWETRPARITLDASKRSIALVVVPVVLIWWDVLRAMLEGFGGFIDYAMASAVLGGVLLAAIVLWLDHRPGSLAGLAGALAWYSGSGILFGAEHENLPIVIESAVMLVTTLFAAVLAFRDLRSRTRSGQVISIAIAVGTIALAVAAPLLSPGAIVASLVFEGPRHRDPQPGASSPEHPEVAATS